MSTLFAGCKGYVHVMGASKGSGVFKLKPPIPNGGGGRCIITGVPMTLREVTQPMTTLNDKRIIYTFGGAWSDIEVSGVLLLGRDSDGGKIISTVVDWYETNRVSKKMGAVSASLGGTALKGYVQGMTLSSPDTKFNIQPFSISLAVEKA